MSARHEIAALAYACSIMPTTEKGTVTHIYLEAFKEALVLCPSISVSLINRLATRFTYSHNCSIHLRILQQRKPLNPMLKRSIYRPKSVNKVYKILFPYI